MTLDARLNPNTGLYSQTLLEVILAHEIARTQRYPSPLSLLHIALCFTHPPTEDIIESAHLFVAQILLTKLRQSDVAGHYKDEFLALLPETDRAGGYIVGTRLLQSLKCEQATRRNYSFHMSVDIGLTFHPGGGTASQDVLLRQASHALEVAKQRGPNTMIVFDELPQP